ncbi:NAD(P)H-dependent oxidoreductase [uncultured Paraglaciecola sp.]|uniref:NADPH-dependent FMN reductase n=1 Tax=uncultured Paraglaciecola sp. TaxID=1765024 RepID=UPI0025971BEB|nr:NAD(P)H-dependent oxidoreductase [uncultured Paraglaciecola sp.]
MKLTIISGSQRPKSQSLNVAHYLKKVGNANYEHINIMDLCELNLPFWNEGVWNGTDEWQPWRQVAEQLVNSDAFIFITPEWHGMATPILKNFLLLTTANELAHKPALLVSVSASVNGVYPISELRMTASKNNHVCLLPDHLIFRNIGSILSDDHNCMDEAIHHRTTYTMELLASYAHALKPIHKAMAEKGQPFVYGM